MSHPQKTCRVLSPSARIGLRPFGAIMPRYALLVAGEPPQQGVNVRSPPASPLASANAALPTSAQTRLCVGAYGTGRAPALAPTTVPIRLGNPFSSKARSLRQHRHLLPSPSFPLPHGRHPRCPCCRSPSRPPPAALAAPATTSATRMPHLRTRTDPPPTRPRSACLLVQWHGKGDAREIKRRGARTRARRPANRRRTAVPPVLPSAVFGHGPAHRVALLHASGVHLPRPRLRPGVARRLRQRHALGRRGDVRGARAARLAHRSPEPPRENERLLRRPDRPRYDDGGPRPHPRRRPYGCGVRRRHGDGHRRSVPLLPLGRGVQPDGRHADAHVRCSVLHRGGGRIVRRQHDAPAVRHPRHRASAPRLACVRTAELPAPARRATPANGRAPPAPLGAARHHGRSGAAVGHGWLAHTGSRVDGSGASRRGDRSGRHRRHRHGPHA